MRNARASIYYRYNNILTQALVPYIIGSIDRYSIVRVARRWLTGALMQVSVGTIVNQFTYNNTTYK